jgi:fatty-acyl-CoA synthase
MLRSVTLIARTSSKKLGRNSKPLLITLSRSYATNTSHVKGATSTQLVDKTYNQLLTEQLNTYPHKDVFKSAYDEVKWTFHQAKPYIDATCLGLVDLKLDPKGSYTIAMPNRAEAWTAQIATALSGLKFGSIQPDLPAELYEKALIKMQPSLLGVSVKVGEKVVLDTIYEVFNGLQNHDNQTWIKKVDARFPYLKHIVHTARKHLGGMIPLKGLHVFEATPRLMDKLVAKDSPSNVSSLIVTPDIKLVGLTQSAIINTGLLIGKSLNIKDEDNVISTLPPHLSVAQAVNVGMTLSAKNNLTIIDEAFNANKAVESIHLEGATAFIGLAEHFEQLLQNENLARTQPKFKRLSKVAIVVVPGSQVSSSIGDLVAQTQSKLKIDNVQVIFSIQQSAGAILQGTGNELNVFPHVEVKVVDGSGKVAPVGTEGELLVKGFNVVKEYLNDAENTKQGFDKDGFVKTGVTAKVNSNGSVSLVKY